MINKLFYFKFYLFGIKNTKKMMEIDLFDLISGLCITI